MSPWILVPIAVVLFFCWSTLSDKYKKWNRYLAVNSSQVVRMKYKDFRVFYALNPRMFFITNSPALRMDCPVGEAILYNKAFASEEARDNPNNIILDDTYKTMLQIKFGFFDWLIWSIHRKYLHITKSTERDKSLKSAQEKSYATLLAEMLEDAKATEDKASADVLNSRETMALIQDRIINATPEDKVPTLSLGNEISEPDFTSFDAFVQSATATKTQ